MLDQPASVPRLARAALIPLLLYRFHLGGVGVWSAVFSAVGVVLLGGLLHRSVDLSAPRLDWRSLWWRLLLVFMPNGILIPVLRGDPAALLTVYLPLLVVTASCAAVVVVAARAVLSRPAPAT